MPKKLRQDWIYVAPQIIGRKTDFRTTVYDERYDIYFNPEDIDDKITIYERQVKDWFLNRIGFSMRSDNYGFIGLMVCLSYLEGVEQYRKGRKSVDLDERRFESKSFFRDSLNRIYPNKFSDNQLNDFYSQARCGLFHNGMTDSKIVYSYEFEEALNFGQSDTIEVNPKILLRDIKNDFNDYIEELRFNNELRENFDRMFNIL